MLLKLAYYGNPILRKKSEPVKEVNDEVKSFVKDLIDSLQAHNGAGLSAPQVFRSERIFVMSIMRRNENDEWEPGPLYVFINPEILEFSEETWSHDEGCLSIPGIWAAVERPYRVKVKALDIEGNEFTKEFEGMEARCIMHENDHLNGVLYIDRIRGKARNKLDAHLREIKKKYAKQV